MTAVYICECGHPKSQHKREREGCRSVECAGACSKFVADMKASAAAQGVDRTRVLSAVAEVCEDQAAQARAELAQLPEWEKPFAMTDNELRTALAKAEQERDRFIAAADKLHGEWLDLKDEVARAEQERDAVSVKLVQAERERIKAERERDEAHVARDALAELYATVCGEKTQAKAELASALQENEQLRAQLAAAAPGLDRLILAYDAWSCDHCGDRSRQPRAHDCGPLTPITVALLRKPTEGAPTA